MIEINLLPEGLRKKRKKIELPEIPIIPITIGIVGIMVAVQIVLGGALVLCRREIGILDKKWQDLAPRKAEIDRTKKNISLAEKKTQTIEYLMSERLSWARLLNEISDSMTSNVWLNELDYTEKIDKSILERVLAISGSSAGKDEEATAHIARFIRALKENENFFRDFNDIELVSIKKGSVSGQDVMDFTLACKFKPKGVDK